jgi:MoxR-like ATPase
MAAKALNRPFFRIDGDSRLNEHKLTGWFDPTQVLKVGFKEKAFFEGPLVQAMKSGGVLFINELNRLPEGTQNVLLPALDERRIYLPKLGEMKAKPGFVVLATQNPKEFVATSPLSEAILDRFELLHVAYQSQEDEVAIVRGGVENKFVRAQAALNVEKLCEMSVRLCRKTRTDARIRRGASVRAAQAIAELTVSLSNTLQNPSEAFATAVTIALPTRIELDREGDLHSSQEKMLADIIADLLAEKDSPSLPATEKKNSNHPKII